MDNNKILFAISSLWLGHATRTSVIINHFLKKWFEIDILSYWNALNFLKSEFDGEKINFIEFTDYPHLERWKWWKFYYYLILDLIKTNIIIRKENNFVKNLWEKYNFIFSDWRYWVYSKTIPSFLLSHQLDFIMPKWLNFFSHISNYFNYNSFKKFDHIFIPDYEDINNSLAWKLSHPNWIKKLNHSYVWILSSFNELKQEKTEKIDYLFTISWYLSEYKDDFLNKLLEQSKKLGWKKVFILWDTKKDYKKELENNITIYSFASWDLRKKLFLNAEIIISRAGYTTIMDLVELSKKAILFPTPNQTEQEYLVKFLSKNNLYVFWWENSNLLELVKKVDNSNIYNTNNKTNFSLEKIEKIISKYK